MIEESLSRLHNATQVELVRIEADRAFWERKYRALEDYCFRKLIPQYIQAFARIAGSDLCLHEDIEVSLKDERGYNANGYAAKCARCSFIITDSNAYPPGHVILEEIDKLVEKAGRVDRASALLHRGHISWAMDELDHGRGVEVDAAGNPTAYSNACHFCGHAPHSGRQCGVELPEGTPLGSHCHCQKSQTITGTADSPVSEHSEIRSES